ncbi:MAG: hypothetical protein HYR55_15355 [Acidobacteria bacterium]|nr:hypothetical protein [Acidobacteriota bacterium]
MARARTLTGSIVLGGAVDEVFRLFSPLGEKQWVPEWDPQILHPVEAEWEEGLIFRTREETGEAVWIVTRLDFALHKVTYHRVEPGRYVARIDVSCRALGQRSTEATIVYAFVGLSDRGNREIAAMTQNDYDAKMVRWQKWITAHLEARLPPRAAHKE